ncbi:MAG TPA: hypothetical protein VMU77_00825, partial [Acidimicrobiales bacterium]|nr:hypothetical protein [Acidimicrobiales bacterium]
SVKDRLVEVIHLMTGKTVDSENIILDIHVDELGDQAADLRAMRAEVEVAEQRLAKQTADTVRALRGRGISLRDIGTLTGVSYQRVHQLVH